MPGFAQDHKCYELVGQCGDLGTFMEAPRISQEFHPASGLPISNVQRVCQLMNRYRMTWVCLKLGGSPPIVAIEWGT